MPSLAELQEVSPLFFQLLFFVVAGALLVGTFVAIVRLMFKYAIAIILIICAFSFTMLFFVI